MCGTGERLRLRADLTRGELGVYRNDQWCGLVQVLPLCLSASLPLCLPASLPLCLFTTLSIVFLGTCLQADVPARDCGYEYFVTFGTVGSVSIR